MSAKCLEGKGAIKGRCSYRKRMETLKANLAPSQFFLRPGWPWYGSGQHLGAATGMLVSACHLSIHPQFQHKPFRKAILRRHLLGSLRKYIPKVRIYQMVCRTKIAQIIVRRLYYQLLFPKFFYIYNHINVPFMRIHNFLLHTSQLFKICLIF